MQSCSRAVLRSKRNSMVGLQDNQTAGPHDRILTFPLFNTCYPQNLARNLAGFTKVLVFVSVILSCKFVTIVLG